MLVRELIGGAKYNPRPLLCFDKTWICVGNTNCQSIIRLPITPQATLPPALPVLRDSSLPPWPRSSVPCRTWIKNYLLRPTNYKFTPWTTIARLDRIVNRTWLQANAEGSSPNNTRRSVKRDDRILHCKLCSSFGIRLNIAQVSDMSNIVIGTTMGFAERIEMRAGSCTSIG